jgi:hypothetical protein
METWSFGGFCEGRSMTIQLTEEQWADVQGTELPARVSDPARRATFVLVREDLYERIKSLFEEDPVTEQERLFQLYQFGKPAGWDDPEMDVYNDLDPRRKS